MAATVPRFTHRSRDGRARVAGWTAVQRQTPSGAVESEQRVVLRDPVVPFDEAGAARLGTAYWAEVRRTSLAVVRPAANGDGVDVRLLRHGPRLLSFAAPTLDASPTLVRCTYAIRGGLLARRPEGEISFAQERIGDELELRSEIRGFFPILTARAGRPPWTGALYTLVQSRIHVAISRRYFARLVLEARR